ncbi:coiled-coil domain-containing protein 138-like isoform X2 [Myxocyprinus asiaticus]|uniref:coiled-coil domain-containing protein 138-like isoform X2 n=1 Tax=Myxocyprinus asiaticus TaxID=70543 RepID=UPI0022236B6E|nr:coiled-coil domain-containing protein 138-like isoform X2 [Myxocyprinus asiaticus]
MSHESDSEIDERIEILKKKYLHRRNQVSNNTESFGFTSDDHGEHDTGADVQKNRHSREMRDYRTALRELHRSQHEQHHRDEDECPEETNIFCTETDVTLPSQLARSSSSCVSESLLDGGGNFMDQTQSSSSGAVVHVYQEMLHIYEKLQAERVSQQAWAADLCVRERELQQRENTLLQQQNNIHRLRGVQDDVIKHMQSMQQKYQQETDELKAALQQKMKENKRMKSSFDSMKEFNDSMKKQLIDVTEQNRKLEIQSRKVQSRLENLQRKFEYSTAHRGREYVVPKASEPKPCKQEKSLSQKAGKDSVHTSTVKLLSVLLDWVVYGSDLTAPDLYKAPAPSLQERCAKVLPLLVEQLQLSALMELQVQLSLLRCIYCCILQLERSTQHAPLTSTLRCLGEEVSRGSADPGNAARSRACPLFKSSCLHTRFLSCLIIIKTISQADILAQALDMLLCAVRTDEGQMLFLQYQALSAILTLLRGGSPALLSVSINILLQMSTESRLLSSILEQCSTEEFFRCATQFLRNPRVEPPLVEKMSIILQKLSSIRKNKRLFEVFSLHLLLQEMHRTADPAQPFLSMNLSSILLNLGMLTRS